MSETSPEEVQLLIDELQCAEPPILVEESYDPQNPRRATAILERGIRERVRTDTKHLFVDGLNGHRYLFSVYAMIEESQLLALSEQRARMSGILPDYVWARKPVIATARSIAGELVREHRLGTTLTLETPRELAETISTALRAPKHFSASGRAAFPSSGRLIPPIARRMRSCSTRWRPGTAARTRNNAETFDAYVHAPMSEAERRDRKFRQSKDRSA